MDTRLNFTTLFLRCYVLAACQGVALGGVFLLGGANRFAGPSFETPRNLFAWTGLPAHWIWGGVFLTYGLALVLSLGRERAVHVLRGGLALYLFLALSFAGSVFADARAAMSGFVSYTIIALIHLVLSDHLHNRGWEGC